MSIKRTLRRRALSILEEVAEIIYNIFNSTYYPWLSEPDYIITGGITAPDGSTTAVRSELVTGAQLATRRMGYAEAGDHNFSCYVRLVNTTTNAQFRIVISGARGAGFDLNTGTISLAAGGTTNVMEDVGDGWYRCSIGDTFTGSSTVMMEYINVAPGDTFEWWGQQHTSGSRDLLPFQFTDDNTPR